MSDVRKGMKKTFVVATLSGLLLLAGCATSSTDSSAPAGAPEPAVGDLGYQGDAGANGEKAGAPQAPAPDGVTATDGPVVGRSLIYRGELSVRVDDVVASADRLTSLVT